MVIINSQLSITYKHNLKLNENPSKSQPQPQTYPISINQPQILSTLTLTPNPLNKPNNSYQLLSIKLSLIYSIRLITIAVFGV